VKRRLPRLVLLVLCAGSSRLSAEVEPAMSLELGGPQKLSANLGFKLGATKANASEVGRGFFFQVQPGLGGGSVNVGFSPVSLASWGTQAVGVVVKARLFRSWGDPWTIEPDQTFAGGEIGVAWIVKVSVGVLQRVQSGAGKATVVTWSVGVGL
jgi:hypothetical protein